jgi:hypothetical protein
MYEDWFQKMESKQQELMKCPVCKAKLGYREKGHPFMEHCEECKTTFTWKMDEEPPKARLDSVKRLKGCDCGRCG